MKDKYKQTQQELRAHLDRQVAFLKRSAAAFDEGLRDEAIRMAVSIRVIVHDTNNSKSVLRQLNLKQGKFLSTSITTEPTNMMQSLGFVNMAMNRHGSFYVAPLDSAPYESFMSFDDWWSEPVFVDVKARQISRKKLILSVSNQDGGAHVDEYLDEVYADLSRANSLGHTEHTFYGVGRKAKVLSIGGAELAGVRQITHELLRSLDPTYTQGLVTPPGTAVFGGAVAPEGRK